MLVHMMWNSFNVDDDDDDDSFSNYNDGQYFVNSNIDTDYDGYQQAWRILGIYVDCSNYYISASISSNNDNNNNNNNKNTGQGCQRYLVWASYIDLHYQGGGIGEYQYYNTTTRTYDDTACITTNNERCIKKMDCHEVTTDSSSDSSSSSSSNTWSLMGIYKEPYYASQFFEQLFKHSGYCVWDSNTYTFMQNSYAMWPDNNSGCVASTTINPMTNLPYYIDLKPGPNMTLGIYIDSMCYQEYVGSDDTTDNIDAIIQNAGYLSSDQIRLFNDAMMSFQHCQPCRSYNLNNVDGLLYGNDNNNNNNADNNQNDPNYPKYSCWDVAGYINVNQCMKFRTHTQMIHMTRKDIHIATLQGTITNLQFYLNHHHHHHSTTTATQQQQQQIQSTITLSSSYHSIYFQPSMNDSNTLHISNTGAYVVLSVAILLTLSTLYYCYNVATWILKKNKKQSPVGAL